MAEVVTSSCPSSPRCRRRRHHLDLGTLFVERVLGCGFCLDIMCFVAVHKENVSCVIRGTTKAHNEVFSDYTTSDTIKHLIVAFGKSQRLLFVGDLKQQTRLLSPFLS